MIFADDFEVAPYWHRAWNGRSLVPPSDRIPPSADVLVIGCGLTGLSAAQTLALRGRSVVAIDAGRVGGGASSQSAGMLGKARDSFLLTAKAHGLDYAITYFRELQAIYDEALQRLETLQPSGLLQQSGRFIGALRSADYGKLNREYEARAKHLGEVFEPVPGSAVGEIASDRYFGGIVVRDACIVDPARYVEGLLHAALREGAQVHESAKAQSIERKGPGFIVKTSKGAIEVRNILLATNGYSGPLDRWTGRRLLPISAYMVATEDIGEERVTALMRHQRSYVDNTRAPRYMRPSPDGRRLVFGSRTGEGPLVSMKGMARKLHADITALFPQMESVRISNVWTGRCAASWDRRPHLGVHEGIHYALGYCFFGMGMAPYLGRLAAERIVGDTSTRTVFESTPLPAIPWFAGVAREITTPLATKYYAWADRPEKRNAVA